MNIARQLVALVVVVAFIAAVFYWASMRAAGATVVAEAERLNKGASHE